MAAWGWNRLPRPNASSEISCDLLRVSSTQPVSAFLMVHTDSKRITSRAAACKKQTLPSPLLAMSTPPAAHASMRSSSSLVASVLMVSGPATSDISTPSCVNALIRHLSRLSR